MKRAGRAHAECARFAVLQTQSSLLGSHIAVRCLLFIAMDELMNIENADRFAIEVTIEDAIETAVRSRSSRFSIFIRIPIPS